MIYQERECEIRVVGGHVVNGMYAFCVEIVEGGEVIDRYAESVPLATLRARAEANGTATMDERDVVIQAAVGRAEDRFRDIVDVES